VSPSPRPLSLAAISDEFSPDPGVAFPAMAGVGMRGAELRVINGRNIIDLSDEEVDAVRVLAEAHGIQILGIASPLLKCDLPSGSKIDPRLQRDIFGAAYTLADQPRLTRRAFEIAKRSGARMIRVFSYWRAESPALVLEEVASTLVDLAEQAGRHGLLIAVENEHACNIATGHEAARLLTVANHPALTLIWDPANALVAGEEAFPEGYEKLPSGRIGHVHVKDCRMQNGVPVWGPVGEMDVDWDGQLRALVRDGYTGWLSLETHWKGPHGDKLEASTICGENLRRLTERLHVEM
jgi:sugar phosphate isomerase/epimerase